MKAWYDWILWERVSNCAVIYIRFFVCVMLSLFLANLLMHTQYLPVKLKEFFPHTQFFSSSYSSFLCAGKGFCVGSAKASSILVPEELIKYSKYKAFVYRIIIHIDMYNLFLLCPLFSALILPIACLDFDTCFYRKKYDISTQKRKKKDRWYITRKLRWTLFFIIPFWYVCEYVCADIFLLSPFIWSHLGLFTKWAQISFLITNLWAFAFLFQLCTYDGPFFFGISLSMNWVKTGIKCLSCDFEEDSWDDAHFESHKTIF